MQASRILPDLQCSLVCEDVRREMGGNFILLGVLAAVRVPQLPIVAQRLCVFTRWTAGLGKFTAKVRLLQPDQTTLIREAEVKFELKDVTRTSTSLLGFENVEFKAAGVYYVEVMVDDVVKLRYPLRVALMPPPPGDQPAQPAPDWPAPAAEHAP
jgi:hypothetical protein